MDDLQIFVFFNSISSGWWKGDHKRRSVMDPINYWKDFLLQLESNPGSLAQQASTYHIFSAIRQGFALPKMTTNN